MAATSPRPLSTSEIDLALDPAWFPFDSTARVAPLDGVVAQPRAVRALEMGLGIHGNGYNIFVIGLSGTHLPRMIRQFVATRVAGQATPPDWVFVNNFDEPDRPLSLKLPPGQGVELRRALRELPQRLAQTYPHALQYQGFNQEKELLQHDYQQKSQELFGQLQGVSQQHGLHVSVDPNNNLQFTFLRDGQPLTPEQTSQLTPEQFQDLLQRQQAVINEAQPLFKEQQAISLDLNESIRKIERVCAEAVLT